MPLIDTEAGSDAAASLDFSRHAIAEGAGYSLAMSQDEVEIIRRVFREWGPTTPIEEIRALLDPAVEMLGAVGGIEEGDVVQGARSVGEAMLVDSEIWADRRYEVQRIVDTDHGVLVLAREHRRGRGSDVEVHADVGFLYEFRDGRIARIRPYMNQADALTAADLRE